MRCSVALPAVEGHHAAGARGDGRGVLVQLLQGAPTAELLLEPTPGGTALLPVSWEDVWSEETTLFFSQHLRIDQ